MRVFSRRGVVLDAIDMYRAAMRDEFPEHKRSVVSVTPQLGR